MSKHEDIFDPLINMSQPTSLFCLIL